MKSEKVARLDRAGGSSVLVLVGFAAVVCERAHGIAKHRAPLVFLPFS